MDVRQTINKQASFVGMLQEEFAASRKVNLFVDDFGMERVSGIIRRIFEKDNVPYLELDNNQQIDIRKIIAANGVFSDDFCEC